MIADNDNDLPRTRAEAKASGSKWYFTGKPCKHGHVAKRSTIDGCCVECRKIKIDKWREKNPEKVQAMKDNWLAANKERLIEYRKQYHANNRTRSNEYSKARRAKNPGEAAVLAKQYREENPEKVKESQKRTYEKKQSTPKGRLENSIRAGVYDEIKKGSKRGRKTFDLLGYTVDQLKDHIESRFLPGMDWDNYGKYGWHIDHIIPLSAHNYETPDDIDFKRAWALSNLQPLWATDNLTKNAKLTTEFQPSLALAA